MNMIDSVHVRHQAIWDKWNQSGGPSYPHEKVVQFIFRHFSRGNRLRSHILDLGCGCGVNTVFLATQGFCVSGLDISPVGLQETRQRLARQSLDAQLLIGSVDAIDLPDQSLDGVISIGVLDCAGPTRFARALREVERVLKPGGRAILVFASDADFRVKEAAHLDLHGFTQAEVDAAVAPIRSFFSEVFLDRYITTYRSHEIEQNDHLVTLLKR